MQLNFSAFARWMTSRIPASDRSAAMPGMRLRERLRRPADARIPDRVGCVRRRRLPRRGALCLDRRCLRPRSEENPSTPGLPARWSKSPSGTISVSSRGKLLFQIDPEPYQIAVDQAEARLGSARLQIDALKATYRQQLAELQSAKDSADFRRA